MSDEGAGAFGLSDGVSSWSDVGVDAAEYSRRVRTLPLTLASQCSSCCGGNTAAYFVWDVWRKPQTC